MSTTLPQARVFNVSINNNEMDHIIKGLELLIQSGFQEKVYDTNDIFYVSPEQLLELLKETKNDSHTGIFGLYL